MHLAAPRPLPAPRRNRLLAAALALASLAALAPPPALAASAPATGPAPVLHLGFGTGVCDRPTADDGKRAANPCWLQLGATGGVRLGALELGAVYEGRELVDLLGAFQIRPTSELLLGGTVGLVSEPTPRWRFGAGVEGGWRRYMNFAGETVGGAKGAADTAFAGLTGRAAFGLRPAQGRTDRLEVSLSWRRDFRDGTDTVVGVAWHVGGWSFTMAVGLDLEW